jgi:hypothetical protein
MKLLFAVCFVVSMICYFLFVREDIKGRLKRPGRWKDMTTYHKVLVIGTLQLPILAVGSLILVLLIKGVG